MVYSFYFMSCSYENEKQFDQIHLGKAVANLTT